MASVLRALLTTDATNEEPAGMADFRVSQCASSAPSTKSCSNIAYLKPQRSSQPNCCPSTTPPAARSRTWPETRTCTTNRGQRKSSGSYFTKSFAVDHLLAEALQPSLDEHLDRVAAVLATDGDTAASDALWDFAVLDPAAGSGHFVVAACEMIVEQFSKFQANHNLRGVADALNRMRSAAETALEGRDPAAATMIRRQRPAGTPRGAQVPVRGGHLRDGRRAVQGAMWVRTFVPGLPMYSLDHQIVSGNILLGVPSVDEAVDLLDPPETNKGQRTLAGAVIRESLDLANTHETFARRLNESDHDEIQAAAAARVEADDALDAARYLFDAALAVRLGYLRTDRKGRIPNTTDADSIVFADATRRSHQRTGLHGFEGVGPAGATPHTPPVDVPGGLRRDRPAGAGFECAATNPPWEKVIIDREAWWGLHLPKVRSKPVAQRRAVIDAHEAIHPELAEEFHADKQRTEHLKKALRKAFPDLGSGHTDLYKAFCWANTTAVRAGGTVAMVLPRSAMSDAGMAKWRHHLLESAGGGGG